MRRLTRLILCCVVMPLGLVLAAAPATATTVSISDLYWGGTPGTYGGGQVPSAATGKDVIGVSAYDIQGMDVTQTGSTLTVKVRTNYVNDGSTNGWIPYGDLLLSTSGWHPYTTAGCGAEQFYACDTLANTGTIWDYAVDTSSGGLYAISKANLVTTDAAFGASNGGTYRTGQATLINGGLLVGAASVDASHAGTGGYLVYTIDASAMGPLSRLALQWNMLCGNDTMQGEVVLPEPSTATLLGAGLLALLGFRRRRALR